MPARTDQREAIANALKAFSGQPLRSAATSLLAPLGYRSERTVNNLGSSTPTAFLNFVRIHSKSSGFSEAKAVRNDWTFADHLFQLTDNSPDLLAAIKKERCV